MKQSLPRGVALLLNVLVIGAVSIAAATVLARGSFDGFLDSVQTLSAWDTRADVFGCLDEVLIQLQKNDDFSEATVFTGTATCSLTVSTPASGERQVVVSLTEGDSVRSVTASVTLSPFTVDQITEP